MMCRQHVSLVLLIITWLAGVQAGPAYQPEASLSGVNVWTNANNYWFQQPELSASSNYFVPAVNDRPNFGISLSGGEMQCVQLHTMWCVLTCRK